MAKKVQNIDICIQSSVYNLQNNSHKAYHKLHKYFHLVGLINFYSGLFTLLDLYLSMKTLPSIWGISVV